MSALKILQTYTYDDYKEWEDSWELIDGIPYAMAPAPFPKHQRIVFHISKELDKNLDCIFKNACEVYISPVDWKVDETTVVQPDVAIFCQKSDKQYFSNTPLLVVEVLSKATAKKDTTVKFDLYERKKVKTYILVEPETQRVQIYEIKDEKYELVKEFADSGEYEFVDETCRTFVDFVNVF